MVTGLTVNQLRLLTDRLGGTQGAVKAVSAAVSAGFAGDMLEQVATLGTRLEEMGSS